MATSGLYVWDLTRNQIITEALRIAGALGDWESASTQQIDNAIPTLESIIKSKQTLGMPLWATEYEDIPCTSFVSGLATLGTGGDVVMPKPLKLFQAFMLDANNPGYKQELAILDRQSFHRRLLTGNTGTPNAIYLLPQKYLSSLHLSPIPDTYALTNCTVQIHYQAQIEDVGGATNEINFPTEWLLVIQYELANVLAAKYGTAMAERNAIVKELEYLRKMTESFDVEEGSLYIKPLRS